MPTLGPLFLLGATLLSPDRTGADSDFAPANSAPKPAADSVVAPTPDSIPAGKGDWVALPFVMYTPETGIAGEFILRHFPDVFHGIGPGTPDMLEESYTSRVARAGMFALFPIGDAVRIGPSAGIRYEKILEGEEGGLLDQGAVRGSDGGTVVGVGLMGTLDTRDNQFSPRRGSYVELWWSVHDGRLGSDFDFTRVTLDARHFIPLTERTVVGVQGYLETMPGSPPFPLLPLLGGSRRMRGYREGRYRDHLFIMTQAELRFPLRGRFDGAVFTSAGQVARRVGDLDASSMEVAAGAGSSCPLPFTEEESEREPEGPREGRGEHDRETRRGIGPHALERIFEGGLLHGAPFASKDERHGRRRIGDCIMRSGTVQTGCPVRAGGRHASRGRIQRLSVAWNGAVPGESARFRGKGKERSGAAP